MAGPPAAAATAIPPAASTTRAEGQGVGEPWPRSCFFGCHPHLGECGDGRRWLSIYETHREEGRPWERSQRRRDGHEATFRHPWGNGPSIERGCWILSSNMCSLPLALAPARRSSGRRSASSAQTPSPGHAVGGSYGSTSGLSSFPTWRPPCAPSTFTRPKPSSPG